LKLWDYHIHLENGPFTMEWLKKFIDKGFGEGLAEIGISEHGYRFRQAEKLLDSPGKRREWAASLCTEDLEDYLSLIQKAKDEGYMIKLGIEMDYVPEHEEEIREFVESYRWDYVLGSVHWIDEWGFDIPEMKEEWDRRDVYEVYLRYFSDLKKAVHSGIFDIIAHPDVIKVFGFIPKKDIKDMYYDIADAVKQKGLCLEVSTAGLRKPVREMYPSEEFLKICSQQRIPIIINSDAHTPEDVGRDFEKAYNYAKRCGCTIISRFKERKRYDLPLK